MALERYRILDLPIAVQPKVEPYRAEEIPPIILPEDSVLITMANTAPETKSYITIHNLADYRRKTSSILLIPNVEVEIDSLLFNREELLECTFTL